MSFFFFFNDTATTEIYTFPYTTLFRSEISDIRQCAARSDGIGSGATSLGDGVLKIRLCVSSGQELKRDEVSIQPRELRACGGRVCYATTGNSRIGARTEAK